MNIKVPVPARLQFLRRHEEFLVKLFVQLVKHKAAFRRNERAVGIAVFLIPNIHDRLAFFVNLVQHPDKILLIIAVIAVTFRNLRLHLLQRALHDVVHLGNGDALLA